MDYWHNASNSFRVLNFSTIDWSYINKNQDKLSVSEWITQDALQYGPLTRYFNRNEDIWYILLGCKYVFRR